MHKDQSKCWSASHHQAYITWEKLVCLFFSSLFSILYVAVYGALRCDHIPPPLWLLIKEILFKLIWKGTFCLQNFGSFLFLNSNKPSCFSPVLLQGGTESLSSSCDWAGKTERQLRKWHRKGEAGREQVKCKITDIVGGKEKYLLLLQPQCVLLSIAQPYSAYVPATSVFVLNFNQRRSWRLI